MENAKIYKIINDIDDKIYVGSSTYYRLCERMNVHRHHAKDESGRRRELQVAILRTGTGAGLGYGLYTG